MSLAGHLSVLARLVQTRATRFVLRQRILARHATLICDPTVIWDYGYRDIDAIEIGRGVSVAAFTELVVYRHVAQSGIEGRLILADGCSIGTGTNIRAAGGTIRIGSRTAVSQHCVLVAANHLLTANMDHFRSKWDEVRTGVELGDQVWIGSSCVLLPGTRIGDNAVVAAGSVVRGLIPANEVWGGVLARKLRDL